MERDTCWRLVDMCALVDARFPYFFDSWCYAMKFIKVKADTCHINIPRANDTLLINNNRDFVFSHRFFLIAAHEKVFNWPKSAHVADTHKIVA